MAIDDGFGSVEEVAEEMRRSERDFRGGSGNIYVGSDPSSDEKGSYDDHIANLKANEQYVEYVDVVQ